MSIVGCAALPGVDTGKQPITVVIVEDYAPLRALYEWILAEESAIRCVGWAASGTGALRLADELRPDVVLLDVSLPNANWLHMVRLLKEICPATHIVVLGESGGADYHAAAKASGASIYMRKEHTIEQLAPLICELVGKGKVT